MKAEDLSPELIAALKGAAIRCSEEFGIRNVLIYKGADLFDLRKEVCHLTYQSCSNKHFDVIVRCYLFERVLAPKTVNNVPKCVSRWEIRFHPASEIKPTETLIVSEMEEMLAHPNANESKSDVQFYIHAKLYRAWKRELENLEKTRIHKNRELRPN